MTNKQGSNKGQLFYIGGKAYKAETERLLCSYEVGGDNLGLSAPELSEALYYTHSGAFLLVRVTADMITAEILTRNGAQAFMDSHPADIHFGVYDALLGAPEEG